MKFSKKFLRGLLDCDEHLGGEVIQTWIVGKRRWSVNYHLVFKYDDKFYRTGYSVAATESQDEQPFEYDPDEIECPEVRPVEKTIITYEEV